MGRPKLTNEQFDKSLNLVGRGVKRITDYNGWGCGIEFECLRCHHHWTTAPDTLRRAGCPKCARNAPYTESIIDDRLKGRPVTRCGVIFKNGSNRTKHVSVKCMNCACIWNANVSNLLNHHTGCPRCGGKERLNSEVVIRRLGERRIALVGDIVDVKTKTDWMCKKCGFKWSAKPEGVLNSKSGCPSCAESPKVNEQLTREYLAELLPDVEIQHNKVVHEKILLSKEVIRCRVFIDFVFVLNGRQIFVEYNGRQHYQPIERFGGEEEFRKIVIRDKWLRDYCGRMGVVLFEIDGRIHRGESIKTQLSLFINQIFK